MPSETSVADYIKILEKAPEWSDVAIRNGPFFFGVFLVLISVVLILLNKHRYISSLFAVCGIALMVWASLLYSGIWSPIHAYTMRISSLAKNHQLALTDSVPLLYMHNLMYDTAREAYHVDLATISPIKLKEGHNFKVILKEELTLTKANGTQQTSNVKHQLTLPFKGKAYSTYELQRIKSEGEEGLVGYTVVETTTNISKKDSPSLFQNLLISVAYANERGQPGLFSTLSPIRLAQVGVVLSADRAALAAEESNTANLNVIYFERPADQGKVRIALSKAEIPYAIEKNAVGKPVNAVWIGVDIPSDVARRIGMSLLTEDVDLRYFGFFTYPDTKTNIVQIGYSQVNANNRSITPDDILSFTAQLRDRKNVLQNQKQQQQEINEIIQKRLQQQQQQQQQRK